MKKRFLNCCCIFFLTGVAVTTQASERPNVLVILLDDLGYNDTGYMGSSEIQTPQIDDLAKSGMTFSDAHVSGTTCSPSRAGILTGRYQQRFGHHHNSPPGLSQGLDVTEKTIGDAFSEDGYKTYYIGKWHLGLSDEYHPNNRGFDEFLGLLGGARSYFPNAINDQAGDGASIQHNHKFYAWDGYLTDLFTDQAMRYFTEDRKGQPFFMMLAYTAPHVPMEAKEEDMRRFKSLPPDRQKLAAMIWSADLGIGKVVTRLEDLGLRDNTLIFFLSDNGGALSNHSDNSPLTGFKGTTFEGGQRTPFILSWPKKIPAGSQYHGLISALDIYPTAAAAAGVSSTIGKPLDGVDILPYVLGNRTGDPHEILFWQQSAEHAARSANYKIVGHDEIGWNLYDLTSDIGETQNIIDVNKEVTKKLRRSIEQWESQLMLPKWDSNKRITENNLEIYKTLMIREKIQ